MAIKELDTTFSLGRWTTTQEKDHVSRESKEDNITRQVAELPANHFPVPIQGDIGKCPVIKRSKMAVRGSKPFIKPMFQGVELGPVTQMPRNKRNRRVKILLQRSK